MAEYLVWVSRLSEGRLWVEADNPVEAMKKADDGDVEWDVEWDKHIDPEFGIVGVMDDENEFVKFDSGDGKEVL